MLCLTHPALSALHGVPVQPHGSLVAEGIWYACPQRKLLDHASAPAVYGMPVRCAQAYAAARQNDQETAYNLGCAFHQLGLLHLAIPLYERALALPPPTPSAGMALPLSHTVRPAL